MFDFIEGQKYIFNTETNCNKSLFFVKLTDSALHSIENVLRSEGNSTAKPTIQFLSNKGIITLPVNEQKITYEFTLSNLEADGSSFQCLQHSKKRSLKSLGPMHIKMQIHANEDSYAKTKCKMAAVEQEQKSLCTKEIKPNGSLLGCKKKISHLGSIYPTKISTLSTKLNQNGFVKPKDKANLALLKEPIRKRIIHILAMKPYKKPDVLLRLIKEGIDPKDRKLVPDILDQVGSPKGNMYTLSSHLWKEVEDNWKFCTKEELELIRRRKLQFLKSVNGVTNSVSQNSVQNRVDNVPVFKEPQNKKMRISHYNNQKVPEQTVKAGSSECNTPSTLKQNSIEKQHRVGKSNQVNGVHNGAHKTNGKGLSSHFNLNRINGMEPNGSSLIKPHERDLVTFDSSNNKLKYHKIMSKEQRSQYALDFNAQYEEYVKLHTKMKDISQKLTSLENHLHNSLEGSDEYKKTRLEIHKMYKTTVQNSHYIEDWKKFNILQSNLSHIKNLIIEYDSSLS